MAQSPALTTRIREDVARLSGFYPDIVSCRVVIDYRDLHKAQGRSFNVRITLGIPEHELVVNHDHDRDVYVALRDAFASLTRQLEDAARRQRGAVKKHAAAPDGTGTPAEVDQE